MLFLCLCAVSNFALSGNQELPVEGALQNPLLDLDFEDCASHGGQIQRICMTGRKACVVEYLDAGKTCEDSEECQGSCRLKHKFVKTGAPAVGQCSLNNDPCGCYQNVRNGIAGSAICLD